MTVLVFKKILVNIRENSSSPKTYQPVTIDELMLRMGKNLERDRCMSELEDNKKLLFSGSFSKMSTDTILDAVDKSISALKVMLA